MRKPCLPCTSLDFVSQYVYRAWGLVSSSDGFRSCHVGAGQGSIGGGVIESAARGGTVACGMLSCGLKETGGAESLGGDHCYQATTSTSTTIYSSNISSSLQLFIHSLGLMRPLCCDQPETLTQGYYPRVDSVAVNAAPRRRK